MILLKVWPLFGFSVPRGAAEVRRRKSIYAKPPVLGIPRRHVVSIAAQLGVWNTEELSSLNSESSPPRLHFFLLHSSCSCFPFASLLIRTCERGSPFRAFASVILVRGIVITVFVFICKFVLGTFCVSISFSWVSSFLFFLACWVSCLRLRVSVGV